MNILMKKTLESSDDPEKMKKHVPKMDADKKAGLSTKPAFKFIFF